jgi:O-antigen/teichoic acid export membrane protein
MIGTLYGEKYVYGPFFLTIAVIVNLSALLGSLSSGSLLFGLGETRMLMKQSIMTLAIGLPLGFVLIPTLGITGLIVANSFAGVPSMIWGLYWIFKHYKAKADFQSSAKILLASAIAAATAYLPTYFLNTFSWVKLVIGLIIFLAVYLLGAPVVGAVSQVDIANLRTMFSGMDIVSKIMSLPLNAAEWAAQTKIAKKKRGKKS